MWELLIYVVMGFLLSRLLQVVAEWLLYKEWRWGKLRVKNYEGYKKWMVLYGDLIAILSGIHLYIVKQSWEWYILDIGLVVVLLLTIMTDIRERLILNVYTYPAMLLMGIGRWYLYEWNVWVHLVGGLIIGLLLSSVTLLMEGKLGGGDLKLFIALGFYFGIFDVIRVMLFSSLLGLCYGLIRLYQTKKREPFPFGPFIVAGTMMVWLGL